MKNKKAETESGEFLMLLAYIMIMVAIGAGIWTGISFFFGSEYDFRLTDAKILNDKISTCIQNSEINWNNQDKDFLTQDFLAKCQINQNALNNSLFIQIKKGDLELLRLGKGDEVQCSFSEKNILYPKCFNSTIYKDNNTESQFFILTGSNQKSQEKLT